MIKDNLKPGMTVGINVDGAVFRGELVDWDDESKTYDIKITHKNGERMPPKTASWDGPIMGIV